MTDFKKIEELHKKLEKINSKYDPDMNFEHELLEHLKNKFPKEYKLTIEAKKQDEPDEDPENITPGRISEYMGSRVDEFIDEYESALKQLVESSPKLDF